MFTLGMYEARVHNRLADLTRSQFVKRLKDKDVSLWKNGDKNHESVIRNRLGWLSLFGNIEAQVKEWTDFASDIRQNFISVVLLGMGGSSLAPEVFGSIFKKSADYPAFFVLDSTDPQAILGVEKLIDVPKTLFIVSSKSGTTLETLSFFKYFHAKVSQSKANKAGENFIAITDPGTPLEKLANEKLFRKVFPAPSDVGGRYSALTAFGMVPAALQGMDIKTLFVRAREAQEKSLSCMAAEGNAAARLGVTMAELAKGGRDKLTFMISPEIESFGHWVEQLIAESLGKEGKGIIPVVGESVDAAHACGEDRLFVYLRLKPAKDSQFEQKIEELKQSGHPVVQIELNDLYDVGWQFVLWEIATAVAGALLEVNPFDEPNVADAKVRTQKLLEQFTSTGVLPAEENEIDFEQAAEPFPFLRLIFNKIRAGDYMAIMAYLAPSEENKRLLARARKEIKCSHCHVAATLGFGPRFLHSTGQLHKGGPNKGIFIQVTGQDEADIPIPGEQWTFGTIKQAQSLGDYQSLISGGRRVIRLNLGKNVQRSLKKLVRAFKEITTAQCAR